MSPGCRERPAWSRRLTVNAGLPSHEVAAFPGWCGWLDSIAHDICRAEGATLRPHLCA
jgi:hypothetical protein